MSRPIVVFDFDGTLTSSTELALEIINTLAPEFGFAPVRPEEIPLLRALGARKLISHFNIPLRRIPHFVRRIRAEHALRIERAEPFPGMPEAIRTLRSQGFGAAIMSSNETTTILSFLKRHGLEKEFDFIYAGSRIFGKSAALRRMLKERGFDPGGVVYVGDETRDRDACAAAGIPFVGVAWGLNTPEAFGEGAPPIADSPKELPTLIAEAASLRI